MLHLNIIKIEKVGFQRVVNFCKLAEKERAI